MLTSFSSMRRKKRVRRECDEENSKQSNISKPVWNRIWAGSKAANVHIALTSGMHRSAGYLTYKAKSPRECSSPSTCGSHPRWGRCRTLAMSSAIWRKTSRLSVNTSGSLIIKPDIVMPARPVPIEHFRVGSSSGMSASPTVQGRKKDDLNDDTDEAKPNKPDESKEIRH